MAAQAAQQDNTRNLAKDSALSSDSRFDWKHVLSPLELRALSALSTLLGLVVLLISVTTDNWLSTANLTVGLWGPCMQPGCAVDPDSIESGKETINITRGTMVTAICWACISVILISISFYRNRISEVSLARAAALTDFVASLFIMIGMSVYTKQLLEEQLDSESEAEWSFDAGWVSFPLLFLAGFITAILSCIES